VEQTFAQWHLSSQDPTVRARAVLTLGNLDNAEAGRLLGTTLRTDSAPEVRSTAARVLGKAGHTAALTDLFAAVNSDSSLEVRASAIQAIGNIRDAAAVPGLIALWRTYRGVDDGAIHAGSVEALKQIGSRGIPELLEVLKDPDWRVRWMAVSALRSIGGSGLRAQIAALAADPHALVRAEVELALGALP